MTPQEFSIEFDILYNNLASNAAPPINEYEKSVLLTKAQSDIVLELYSGRNQLGISFESNEEARQYLKILIVKASVNLNESTPTKCNNYSRYTIDKDWRSSVLFSIKEEIESTTDKGTESVINTYPVVPISTDTLESTIKNPFKGPKKNRRAIITDTEQGSSYLYVDTASDNCTYNEWYIRYPYPIILPKIEEEGITVGDTECAEYKEEGLSCELPKSLHYAILERAVQLAKMAYIGGQKQE